MVARPASGRVYSAAEGSQQQVREAKGAGVDGQSTLDGTRAIARQHLLLQIELDIERAQWRYMTALTILPGQTDSIAHDLTSTHTCFTIYGQ